MGRVLRILGVLRDQILRQPLNFNVFTIHQLLKIFSVDCSEQDVHFINFALRCYFLTLMGPKNDFTSLKLKLLSNSLLSSKNDCSFLVIQSFSFLNWLWINFQLLRVLIKHSIKGQTNAFHFCGVFNCFACGTCCA